NLPLRAPSRRLLVLPDRTGRLSSTARLLERGRGRRVDRLGGGSPPRDPAGGARDRANSHVSERSARDRRRHPGRGRPHPPRGPSPPAPSAPLGPPVRSGASGGDRPRLAAPAERADGGGAARGAARTPA